MDKVEGCDKTPRVSAQTAVSKWVYIRMSMTEKGQSRPHFPPIFIRVTQVTHGPVTKAFLRLGDLVLRSLSSLLMRVIASNRDWCRWKRSPNRGGRNLCINLGKIQDARLKMNASENRLVSHCSASFAHLGVLGKRGCDHCHHCLHL